MTSFSAKLDAALVCLDADERKYKVWVKGKRLQTEIIVSASHKISALIKCANRYGIKTYECDGLLLRESKE